MLAVSGLTDVGATGFFSGKRINRHRAHDASDAGATATRRRRSSKRPLSFSVRGSRAFLLFSACHTNESMRRKGTARPRY